MTRRLPRVRVSANTLLLVAFLAIFDRGFTLIVPLLAALMHELGHIVVMLCCGIEIRQIKVSLFARRYPARMLSARAGRHKSRYTPPEPR